MLFVIHAIDKAEHVHVRAAHTAAHVQYLKAQPLQIHLAGPLLADDGETAVGSLLVIDAPDRRDAVAFSQRDPYTRAQLFEEVRITALRKVVGWIE